MAARLIAIWIGVIAVAAIALWQFDARRGVESALRTRGARRYRGDCTRAIGIGTHLRGVLRAITMIDAPSRGKGRWLKPLDAPMFEG